MFLDTYTRVHNSQTNFADVERVVIAPAALGARVDKGRVFPCAGKTSVIEENITFFELRREIKIKERKTHELEIVDVH